MSWTSGYMADIGYTYGYYTELNPLRTNLALLNAGLVSPRIQTACELGYGQGLSANFHAAASNTRWWGTDFNPSQAGFAQELAAASGAGAKLYDDAFTDFINRKDLPDFDYIGIHGIWSWISDDNRRVLVDFIQQKLTVGGILYISYNTLPGWAAFAPMRHLMSEHSEIIGAEGLGIVGRIDGAIDFAQKLLETNPMFSKANPLVQDRIKKLAGQNRHYLAHEYFNRDWHPMHFAGMAKWLEPARLQYACSANYLDHIASINLTADQQAFLNEIQDPMFRQSVRDFMVNQQFRKDYWVKGARRLSSIEQVEKMRSHKLIILKPRAEISLKVNGALGEATMNAEVYNPILDFMADHKIRTIGQIEEAMRDKKLVFAQVVEAVMLLIGSGVLAQVQESTNISKVKSRTDKLNRHLMDKARGSHDIAYLASPVTGGGVSVDMIQQLFMLAMNIDKSAKPSDWAKYAWNNLQLQGRKLVKEGKSIESDSENLDEMNLRVNEFIGKSLPILNSLKIL